MGTVSARDDALNTKLQSNIGLGQAIAYFTGEGMSVSLPLTESQRYDLIVDDGSKLFRVEVKTTRTRRASGSYVVTLSTQGGNQSWDHAKKLISENDCDLVFVHVVGGGSYVFPVEMVAGRASLTLSSDKDRFIVNG